MEETEIKKESSKGRSRRMHEEMWQRIQETTIIHGE